MKLKRLGRFIGFCLLLCAIILYINPTFRGRYLHLSTFSSMIRSLSDSVTSYTRKYTSNKQKTGRENSIDEKILSCLKQLEAHPEDIKKSSSTRHKGTSYSIAIPKGFSSELIVWNIYQAIQKTAYAVSDCILDEGTQAIRIELRSSESDQIPLTLHLSQSKRYRSNNGKIAFVIDNFSFAADKVTTDILSLQEPLTLCLLPSSPKSEWAAHLVHEYKKEIIVLLPLESTAKIVDVPQSWILMVHYPQETINKIFSKISSAIPFHQGYANLYGSLALEDSRFTDMIMKKIKQDKGYFLDMRQSKGYSVVPTIAANNAVASMALSHTLESDLSTVAMQEQLAYYGMMAQKKNKLTISVKASQPFITALQKTIPIYKYNGIQLVYISELINEQRTIVEK
ncbi:MAG: divergent polysaccharide deacetylase family protein [Chitinivibrionales bacterium]|nr:divergent polysaccharide deacetylase family protein [Chitinivibrionales bacterium]